MLSSRLITGVFTLFLSSFFIFIALEILPGDSALTILGMHQNEKALEILRTETGLHQNFFIRYFSWIYDIIRGNLGHSLSYSVPISELLMEGAKVSLPLALISFLFSAILGIPAGIFCTWRQASFMKKCVLSISHASIAIPSFCLALILLESVAIRAFFPHSGGFPGWETGPLESLKALLLPALSLVPAQASILASITRSAFLDILDKDYIHVAKAKGVHSSRILWHHVFPNAALPILTLMGMQFAFLISGAIIIENIFQLPGLGRLILRSLEERDLIVVRNACLSLLGVTIIVNTLVDCIGCMMNPHAKQAKNR